jgi:glycine oxidase
MHPAPDVVVVGDGLVGLFTAEALARRGLVVTVAGASRPGTASEAAAGMLGWRTGSKAPGAAFALGRRSAEAWSAFLPRLGGADALGHRAGTLVVGSREAVARIDASLWWQGEVEGLAPIEAVDPAAIPAGRDGTERFGRFFPDEDALDPRLARAALSKLCKEMGVRFLETAVTGLVADGDRMSGVLTGDGARIDAGAVVVAAGAWSAGLEGLGAKVPVVPLRGQMVVLAPARPPPHVVHLPCGRYLVPRPDGRVLVGSTEEEAGFDSTPTEAALQGLASAAAEGWPELSGAPRVAGWAGLRPVTPDRIPIVGPSARPGLWYATGHGRNGVLFAPVTGESLGRWIAEGDAEPLLRSWLPARFGL